MSLIWKGESEEVSDTPYQIICPNCGTQPLTEEQYTQEMRKPNKRWTCFVCGETCEWDDDHYDEWQEKMELEAELKTIAKQFHKTYERLAVEYGWKSQESCQVPFEQLPEENRELMLAVVREVCTPLFDRMKAIAKDPSIW